MTVASDRVLCPTKHQPMNALLRKHSSSLLTLAIYAAIITFSLLVTFGLI